MVSISKLTADVDVSEYYDKYVDIEKFLEICKECDQYGNNWGCPPFVLILMKSGIRLTNLK